MQMLPVKSSSVTSMGHDPATNTMHVEFKSGGTYAYSDVPPEKFEALQAAPSIGKHLHAHIKPNHTATLISKPHK